MDHTVNVRQILVGSFVWVLPWLQGCRKQPPSWWQSGILEQRLPLCSFLEPEGASSLHLWLQNTHFPINTCNEATKRGTDPHNVESTSISYYYHCNKMSSDAVPILSTRWHCNTLISHFSHHTSCPRLCVVMVIRIVWLCTWYDDTCGYVMLNSIHRDGGIGNGVALQVTYEALDATVDLQKNREGEREA